MEEFHEVQQQSYLQWYITSLGVPTLLAIVGVTMFATALVIVLFLRGRGPAVPAAIAFILPLPLIVGALAFLGGTINYLYQIALAGEEPIKHESFAYALTAITQASSCFCPLLILSLALLMTLGFRGSKS